MITSIFEAAAIAAQWHAKRSTCDGLFAPDTRFTRLAARSQDLAGEELAVRLLALDDEALDAEVESRVGRERFENLVTGFIPPRKP